MSRMRWALVTVVLATTLAQVIHTPARASRPPAKVLGVAQPAEHQVRVQADGAVLYKGPFTDLPTRSSALGALLAGPSEATSAALSAATQDRWEHRSATAGATFASSGAVAIGRPPQYVGSMPSLVGDLNGDGLGDLATLDETPDGRVLEARSGADGGLLWTRAAPYLAFSAQVAGAAGFLLIGDRFEAGDQRLLRSEHRRVLTVEAIDGRGRQAWRTEVAGAFHTGPLRSTVTDLPSFETVGNVVGGSDDEIVLTLTNETRWRSEVRPPSQTSTVAVLDGATGALERGPALALTGDTYRWFDPIADLDRDGRLELLERRWVEDDESTHILSGLGAEWWGVSDGDWRGWVEPVGGDLDLDGVDDVLWTSYLLTCAGPPEAQSCTIDLTVRARSGRDGAVLATWEDVFPGVVGDVDGDGRTDLQLGRPVRDDEAGTFGLALSVVDITGRTIRESVQSHALPEAPWQPWVSWGLIGDVDADAIADMHWLLGRYEPPADPDTCTCAGQIETLVDGRLAGATGAALPSAPESAWATGTSFDGAGDDYFALGWGETDGTASAFDGLDGHALWSATVAVDYPSDYLSVSWADVDGDGGTDTLFGVHESWETPEGPEPRASYVLIDGATGAVRWRLDTSG